MEDCDKHARVHSKHRQGPLWTSVVVVLLLMGLLQPSTASSWLRRRCRPPSLRHHSAGLMPTEEAGLRLMEEARGSVTIVALLINNCGFCLSQAERMETLRQTLQARGEDVHMMIIDAGPVGLMEAELARRVSFDIHRDNRQTQLWRLFRGTKDDIIVFDRCGQMTFHLHFPVSYLGYIFVERAINRTLYENPCSCSLHTDLHDRMLGDAPAQDSLSQGREQNDRHLQRPRSWTRRRYRGHFTSNRSRCPNSDPLCRQLKTVHRQYRNFRRQLRHQPNSPMTEQQFLEQFGSFMGMPGQRTSVV